MFVEDLEVYNRLTKLVMRVHVLTMKFPRFELYELGSQLRRSSNSIAANVAEGFGNKHTNIYAEGIYRAMGELRETKHHLRIAYEKSYITTDIYQQLRNEYEICSKMLYRLERSLRKHPPYSEIRQP